LIERCNSVADEKLPVHTVPPGARSRAACKLNFNHQLPASLYILVSSLNLQCPKKHLYRRWLICNLEWLVLKQQFNADLSSALVPSESESARLNPRTPTPLAVHTYLENHNKYRVEMCDCSIQSNPLHATVPSMAIMVDKCRR
jgi:hypothetical protein